MTASASSPGRTAPSHAGRTNADGPVQFDEWAYHAAGHVPAPAASQTPTPKPAPPTDGSGGEAATARAREEDLRAAAAGLGESFDRYLAAEWARTRAEAREGVADLRRALAGLAVRADDAIARLRTAVDNADPNAADGPR